MVKITFSSIFAFAGICALLVQADVILHRPIPNEVGGTSQIVSASVMGVSAVAALPNGATQYVETVVQSLVVYASGTVRSTLLSTPTTLAVTFAEGASTYSAAAEQVTTIAGSTYALGVDVQCSETGNGGEVNCVQVLGISLAELGTTAITTSFVGTTSPIFTITTTGSPPPSPTSSGNRIAFSTVSASFLVGFVYVLLRAI